MKHTHTHARAQKKKKTNEGNEEINAADADAINARLTKRVQRAKNNTKTQHRNPTGCRPFSNAVLRGEHGDEEEELQGSSGRQRAAISTHETLHK